MDEHAGPGDAVEDRPELGAGLEPGEFDRWYWTVADLRTGAHALGVSTTGRKADLSARVRAALAGEVLPTVRPLVGRDGLTGDLTLDTQFAPPQRMTRRLRAFMEEHCGTGFRFDRHMRAFFAGSSDASSCASDSGPDDLPTLGDAVALWFRTRDEPAAGIDEQFEYNRFVRRHRDDHPDATHAQVVAAWHRHRSRPRGRSTSDRPGTDGPEPG